MSEIKQTAGRTPITAAMVAAHLGVSKSTVTHVLNGHGTQQRIRPETQQRVLDAAQSLGYRPNVSARAIRTGRFGCAALIQSLKALYLPTELLQGISEALTEHDMHLSLAEVPEEVIDDQSYVPKVVRELSADGLLINRIQHIPPEFLERLRALQTPAIFINVKQDTDSAYPDDRHGGEIAAEYLLGLGHTKIAYAGAAVRLKEHYSEFDRRSGYESVMALAALAPLIFRLPPDPLDADHQHPDPRVETATALLARPGRPTAVIAYELAEAMAFVHAAGRLGLRIPEDLSLLTFHWGIDHRLCLPITTVTNAMRQVGREAVRMLVTKIDNGRQPLPSRAVPVDLLKGMTCGPPASRNSPN